jgi:hypothetical protein
MRKRGMLSELLPFADFIEYGMKSNLDNEIEI